MCNITVMQPIKENGGKRLKLKIQHWRMPLGLRINGPVWAAPALLQCIGLKYKCKVWLKQTNAERLQQLGLQTRHADEGRRGK